MLNIPPSHSAMVKAYYDGMEAEKKNIESNPYTNDSKDYRLEWRRGYLVSTTRALLEIDIVPGERGKTFQQIVADIDAEHNTNLSSAIRLYILRHYRNQLDQQDEMVAPLDLDLSNSIEAR
jgi:hypothetical protein